jgi:hypothetical protein
VDTVHAGEMEIARTSLSVCRTKKCTQEKQGRVTVIVPFIKDGLAEMELLF